MTNNRRDFIKKAGLLSLASSLIPSVTAHSTPSLITDDSQELPGPDSIQQAWMDMKFGMFIHFGINTYYDKEWSDGTLDPVKFNPGKLDTDQWCSVAKAAGMKYIVLITKHHDGFCLWPTQRTDYSVASTPFKKDVVAALVNSAQKYGLKVGFYYSLWDRHEKLHDEDEYRYVHDFMLPQLKELLTQYGDIVELWFDGFWKKQQSGWKTKISDEAGDRIDVSDEADRNNKFIASWRNEGAFRWQMDYVYQYIKSIQPNCLVMNNATTAYPGVPLHPVDILSGERATEPKDYQRVWEWLGKNKYFPMQIETTMSTKGNEQFKRGSWFWHDWDHSVLSKEEVLNYITVAGKMNSNLLLNCGPMDTGQLRPEDVNVLNSLYS